MSAFVIKVKTDNAGTSNSDQFTLPGNSSYSYNFDVDWGDGSPVETINTGSSWTHTFTGGAGTYSISITENVAGGFPTIRFNAGGDCLKLLEIVQWGTNRWDTFDSSFYACSNLEFTASDHATADTGGVTSFYFAFAVCQFTSFPLIDTSGGQDFNSAWINNQFTSFPLIDTSSALTLRRAWKGCSLLTSFHAISTSTVTDFYESWQNSGLTSFPLIDTSAGTTFRGCWQNTNLTECAQLDFTTMNNGVNAFAGVTLSTESYDAILANSFANNVNNSVTFHGGDSKYAESGKAVRDVLTAAPRSWTITDGGFEPGLLSTGLQGWWCPSLDTAGNGTTTLTDLSGNGNNGTLTNMDAATDWVADTTNGGVRALDYDGSNDVVIAAHALPSFAGDFFVAAWVKPASWTKNDQAVLVTRNIFTGAARNGIALFLRNANQNNVVFEAVKDGTRHTASLSTNLNVGTWYFIYGHRNATSGVVTVGVYGVGTATAGTTTTDTITHEEAPHLGNWQDYSTGDFMGRLDGVMVYERIPSVDEIDQLYNGGRSLNLLGEGTTQSIVPQLLLRRRRMSGGGLVI